jgi:signal transduction histidine kinase
MSVTRAQKRWQFKLRTILLIVNLVLLLLPLAGIFFFRVYENELVKQTELELISQAAFIAAAYKQEVGSLLESAGDKRPYGIQVNSPWPAGEFYRPVGAQLHLSSHNIQPRPRDAIKTEIQADAIGLEAGARLAPTLFDAQRTALSGIRILDYRGIVVGGRSEVGLSYAHLGEVQRALTGRYSSAIRARVLRQSPPALASISRGTGIRVFAAFPILKDDRLLGVVLLSRTPRTILQHLYDERETVVLVVTSLLLLALGLAVFTSYTIARPLHALIEQTKQFGREDKEGLEPLKSPVTEEVARLSESFSEMARRVEHRSEYIRNFAAHVSHEFKTPLAGIQGAIELLQEHAGEMSAEQRERFLENISQDTVRLKRLVDRLLEMARADVLHAAPGITDIVPLLNKLRERYKTSGLMISLNANSEPTKAQIAPEVLETVFANLFDNSRQNGASRVEVSLSGVHGVWSITVADNGHGISPANADKIFTPFFTTHRESGGTGLGLGIVKTLLKAYGGDIALAAAEQGASFAISIPAAGV